MNDFREKSDKTWTEGRECLARGYSNSAASRIYYAVFQAVYGFAVSRGEMSLERPQRSCHGEAIRIVGEHGTGRRYFRQQMSRLYGLRVIADYNPEDVGIDRVEELVNDADKIRLYFLNLPGANA